MTWVRTDDAMPLHPKILCLSDGAFRLWQNGLHFANRSATDGKIETRLLPSLNHHGRWTAKQLSGFVAELVPGLWIDRGDHYEIHDYAHFQAEALKERVERKRANERDRQRRHRDKTDVTRGIVTRDIERDSVCDNSVPSRPVPSRPKESTSVRSTRGALVRAFQKAWEGTTKSAWTGTRGASEWDDAAKAIEKTAGMRSCEPSALIDSAIAAWLADRWVQDNSYPPLHFARNIARYFGEAKPEPEAMPPLKAVWYDAESRVEAARKRGEDGAEVARLEREALVALEAWRAEKHRMGAA
jgi:hypothetical protein